MLLKAALLVLSLGAVAAQDMGPNCTTCTAAKALPCSGSISRSLVQSAKAYLESADDRDAAFNALTTDSQFKQDSGFYVFMSEFDGPSVAHGANPSFVGLTVPEMVASINSPTDGQAVHDALQAGAEAGGAWVTYDWTNSVNEPAVRKIAYVDKLTKWGQDYFVGSGYNDVSDDLDESCTTSGAAACAEANTLNIMGSLMASLSVTTNMDEILGQITDKIGFRTSSGFYAFVTEYAGTCVAHGARSDFVNHTLPEIMEMTNNPTNGQTVDDALQAGAEAGGAWVTYDWKNNADEEPFTKIAYVMKHVGSGVDYYFGVGYNDVCIADLPAEQELQVCTGIKPECSSEAATQDPVVGSSARASLLVAVLALAFFLWK